MSVNILRYSKEFAFSLVANATIAVGDLVGIDSNGKAVLADGDAGTPIRAVGVALKAGTAAAATVIGIAPIAQVEDTTLSLTPGDPVYLSATAGGITQTALTTSEDLHQEVGIAISATKVHYFVTTVARAVTLDEAGVLDGVTAGTVTASKAVVVDSNKDIASFRDVTMRNLVATGTITPTGNIVSNASAGVSFGSAITQKVSAYGVTPVVQQASAAQAAVTPSTDFTGADTVNKATVLAAVQAVETLVNRLRLDLVTTGWIKGAA